MTREEIERLINKRNEELLTPYIPEEPFERCKKFLEENPYYTTENFLNIDIWEMIYCLFAIENPKNVREIEDLLSSTKDLIEMLETEDTSVLIKTIASLDYDGVLPITIDYLQASNFFEERKVMKELKECIHKKIEKAKYDSKELDKLEKDLGDDILGKVILLGIKESENDFLKDTFVEKAVETFFKEDKELISDLKEETPESKINNLVSLINLFLIDSKTTCEILALKIAHQELKEETEDVMKTLEEMQAEQGIKIKDKEKERVISKYQKETFKLNKIKEYYNRISKYVREELNTIRKQEKAANKETAGYKNTLLTLDRALSQEEIKNPRSIISTATDEEIKKAILKLIYEHNMTYYERLEEQLSELNKNSKNHYIAVLNDFNIQISESDLHKIMINKVADLKEILNIITMIGIKEDIVKILKMTNLNTANRVKDLFENGYASKPYIIKNLDIFNKESKKLDKLENGILIINSYNINPGIFSKNLEILADNQENLVKNLEVLKSYNLLKSLKKATNFTFLTQSNIEEKIDKFLELGYEKFLEEDISLLNTNNIKRLEVLRTLNMNAQSKEELEQVLNSDKFFVKDELLPEYIPNIIQFKDPVKIPIVDLGAFRKTSRTYEIGSNLFSIKKIQRLLSAENDLYTSLFYKVNLTEEEYNSVLKALDCYEIKK